MPDPSMAEKMREFAKKVSGGDAEPFFVEVRPEAGATLGDCHTAAADYCTKHEGCTVVRGWLLTATTHYMEAEYHALVRLPDGTYTDPTPAMTNRVLFVVDEREHDVLIENVISGLVNTFAVWDLISALNDWNREYRKASKIVDGNRQITVTKALREAERRKVEMRHKLDAEELAALAKANKETR